MEKCCALIALLVIVACPLVCIATYQLVVMQCLGWECAPYRSFTVVDLALPSDLFPADARVGDFQPLSEGGGEAENGYMSIYYADGKNTALYMVLRFGSERRAHERYSRKVGNRANSWGTPEDLDYHSAVADEFFVGCGGVDGGPACMMVARYDEYVISYREDNYNGMLVHERFRRIVEYIDKKMAFYLKP